MVRCTAAPRGYSLAGIPLAGILVTTLLLAAPALAENWPQWRGPHGDGSSTTANPPLHWNETTNVRWKVELPGRGSSTPIIWGDRLFLLAARPINPASQEDPASQGGDPASQGNVHQFLVLAYDRHSGEPLWQRVATEQTPHEAGHATNTLASSSPVTDGQHLYVNFGSRGVYCFDLDGNLKWQRDLGKMQTRGEFGEAASPALHENTLVVPWDHEGQSSLFALDARTGETRWQVQRDEPTTWATPLITPWNGRWQVVTNGVTVRSYALDSGELLWQAGGQVTNPIPTPVRFQDTVIAMTGFRGNAIHAVRLDAQGDVTGTEAVVWSRSDAAPYVASPALYQGRLHFTKSRDGIYSSVDAASGEVVIAQQRLPGIRSIYASPVAAQDRIYVTGREGTTVVLRHVNAFEVLATNQLDDMLDASPALSGDRIYLRGDKHLYCIAAAATD